MLDALAQRYAKTPREIAGHGWRELMQWARWSGLYREAPDA